MFSFCHRVAEDGQRFEKRACLKGWPKWRQRTSCRLIVVRTNINAGLDTASRGMCVEQQKLFLLKMHSATFDKRKGINGRVLCVGAARTACQVA